jgi:phosphonate transport system substrate-binding protein
VKPDQIKIVWQSDPLPNDPLVVRADLDPALVKKIQEIVLAITEEQALAFMPKNYTGWVTATHASYKLIEDAGITVGRIKPKTN